MDEPTRHALSEQHRGGCASVGFQHFTAGGSVSGGSCGGSSAGGGAAGAGSGTSGARWVVANSMHCARAIAAGTSPSMSVGSDGKPHGGDGGAQRRQTRQACGAHLIEHHGSGAGRSTNDATAGRRHWQTVPLDHRH